MKKVYYSYTKHSFSTVKTRLMNRVSPTSRLLMKKHNLTEESLNLKEATIITKEHIINFLALPPELKQNPQPTLNLELKQDPQPVLNLEPKEDIQHTLNLSSFKCKLPHSYMTVKTSVDNLVKHIAELNFIKPNSDPLIIEDFVVKVFLYPCLPI